MIIVLLDNYGLNSFVSLLKTFIADVLKCKVRLKAKFECVCVTMYSLVMCAFFT